MTRTIHVALGARGYDVVVGPDALDGLTRGTPPGAAFVLYDEAVAPVADRVVASLRAGGRRVVAHAVAGDEALKSWERAGALYDALAAAEIDRDGVLVAVGGGTVSDVGGFVAATYLRGIAWVAVPTTLLAAVDAAVGGKTGVNVRAGKNLVGSVHQPSFVAIDAAVLATLDPRDRISGLGEVVKTALVGDAALFDELETSWRAIAAGDAAASNDAVARCVAVKAAVVAADEHDRDGRRAALNFGHTVGHALERVCGYGTLRHGEAVILGMRVAVALSRERGHLPAETAARIDALLAALPVAFPAVEIGDVVAATHRDKKRAAGRVRYVLLRAIGETVLDGEVGDDDVAATLRALHVPAIA